jgi:hypothetical protein
MKMANVIAAVLCGVSLLQGAESGTASLRSTAEQLDDLVSEQKQLYTKVGEPGFKPKRETIPPISLERMAAVVASKLELPEKEVIRTLEPDREKLSELVMARLLEAATGKRWKELFAENEMTGLIRLAEQNKQQEKIQAKLDEVYSEMSLLAMDRIMERGTAKGRAPGGTRGSGKESKNRKR